MEAAQRKKERERSYICVSGVSLLTFYTFDVWFRNCSDSVVSIFNVLDTALCDKVCQWLAAGGWFSPGNPVASTNTNLLLRYNWNIVESGIKHHKPNQTDSVVFFVFHFITVWFFGNTTTWRFNPLAIKCYIITVCLSFLNLPPLGTKIECHIRSNEFLIACYLETF